MGNWQSDLNKQTRLTARIDFPHEVRGYHQATRDLSEKYAPFRLPLNLPLIKTQP